MTGKSILGALLTGVALFVFGFLYWAVNPLPYTAWNVLDDPAAAQAATAKLFPQDGMYVVPGGGNDPRALQLLETGPLVFLTIDHSPAAGPDPASLGVGLLHNIASAFLLVLLIRGVSGGLTARVGRAALVGVVAAFVINGSEIIWWQQPFNWMIHQAIYYVLYFALGAAVLNFFLPEPEAA